MTIILDGKRISKAINNETKEQIQGLDFIPGLGIIIVGHRPDSELYVKMKKRTCNNVGIRNYDYCFQENVDEQCIIDCIEEMNYNSNIHGILIQLPLPKHLNTRRILNTVIAEKDVDGFNEINNGRLALNIPSTYSCTPVGCIELLDRYDIEVKGKDVVIIGASNTVGLPLSLLLLHRGATVTICHLSTKDTKSHTQKADIVFSCCGCAEMVKCDWIKEDSVIVDIGINKQDNKIVGDCDFKDIIDSGKAHAITPVPGGAGPMTVAILMKNTVKCALQLALKRKPEKPAFLFSS
jgi:methylenetetrahydrofolate dehydrogenase (NADP+) / methenyltetrahydrofolate cyclohydrolase